MQKQHHKKIKHDEQCASLSLSHEMIKQRFNEQDQEQVIQDRSYNSENKSIKHVNSDDSLNIYDDLLVQDQSSSSSNNKKNFSNLHSYKKKHCPNDFEESSEVHKSSESESLSISKNKFDDVDYYADDRDSQQYQQLLLNQSYKGSSNYIQEKYPSSQFSKKQINKTQQQYHDHNQKDKHTNINSGCCCKVSKCIKLYCVCFNNKKYCSQECKCLNCDNKVMKTAKRRKLDKGSLGVPQIKKQIEINSCSCKKSYCMNKYCQCYSKGGKCGKYCLCSRCKNKGKNYRRKSDSEQQKNQKEKKREKYQIKNSSQSQKSIEGYLQKDEKNYINGIPENIEFDSLNWDEILKRQKYQQSLQQQA